VTAQQTTESVADTHRMCPSCYHGQHACQGTVTCVAGCTDEQVHTCSCCGSKPETWMALADVSP
jgi:hypothetical protein